MRIVPNKENGMQLELKLCCFFATNHSSNSRLVLLFSQIFCLRYPVVWRQCEKFIMFTISVFEAPISKEPPKS